MTTKMKSILECLKETRHDKKFDRECKGKGVNFIEYLTGEYLKENGKTSQKEKEEKAKRMEEKARSIGEWGRTYDELKSLYTESEFVERVHEKTNLVLEEILDFLKEVDPVTRHKIFSMILPECYSLNDKRTVDDFERTVDDLVVKTTEGQTQELQTLKKCLGEYVGKSCLADNENRDYTKPTLMKITDFLSKSGYKPEETVLAGLTAYKIKEYDDEFDKDKKKVLKSLENEVKESSGLYRTIAERAHNHFEKIYYKIPLNGVITQIEV
jgi:hypothetical protein